MSSVSVIIPVYNSQETLERAVASVIHEALVSEVLIVDDGSTDGSLELALGLAERFSVVRVLQHPKGSNKGACASRNLGLAHAQSDWIQFLDADDELLPGKMAGQLELANSEVLFVVGNSIHVFSDGRRHFRTSDKDVWKGLIRSNLGTTSSTLWNREFIVELGGWDQQLQSSQEYDLMFRLVQKNLKVAFDSSSKTIIHFREQSISNNPQQKEKRIQNWLSLRERIKNHLLESKQFGLKYQYAWSGAVGQFCSTQGAVLPSQINKFLFRAYELELSLKKSIYQLIKP
ncbi:hypothetical protein ADIS_0199 [Lunatimonas lonarensis]|uniref:Glycosyltransferase 2-like domain-containing protein n=1 Tax=Lunatimonas lonarensis TaxID=1232681 RepID=R7ZZ36_9BACT|nr:glycosyltransferase family 2 protein [Lunatimonas lonarensis]EON79319.1 hypothetical protein ADIS_0199 [Lunatimonas lonarensis]